MRRLDEGAGGVAESVRENRLLAALPHEDRQRLERFLEPVMLRFKQVLYAREDRIASVYFPETAVCSFITVMADGGAVEAGTVGWDGAVGADVAIGTGEAAYETIVQVAGRALRMPVDVFLEQMASSPAVRDVVLRHVQGLLLQSFQSTACNRLHTLRQRCCRWLLLTHDRAGRDEVLLTHDILAVMVGVRRPSITATVRVLEREGIIRGARGRIHILDRARLEESSCECYGVQTSHLQRLLALPPTSRSPLTPAGPVARFARKGH